MEAKAKDLPLKDAISSYLFNSQLITLPNGSMSLIAPFECLENPVIKDYIDSLVNDSTNPIKEACYINLRQSMQNGGGPACLRIRVVMTKDEIKAIHPDVFLTNSLYQKLKKWIQTYYRDRLEIKDLADPDLINENYAALDVLNRILNL